jgi:hypothetical protein
MVAGTVVIRERHQPMASPPLFVPGHLVQWAQSLELSRLPDELANTARDYLARFTELQPEARMALGDALGARVAAVTAPPPPVQLIAPAYLSAVLAERRRRELIRLSTLPRHLSTGLFTPPATTQSYAPPSPYGALPPAPPPPVFAPPPPPPTHPRPATVNAQGWAAPGSNTPAL